MTAGQQVATWASDMRRRLLAGRWTGIRRALAGVGTGQGRSAAMAHGLYVH